MTPAFELAPAKLNLFLHVGPALPNGYHPVASWMVFADIGDRLSLAPADRWALEVRGEMADTIGEGENLVARAARLLFGRAEVDPPPLRVTLDKTLPVAAGLGGGSSDAGAALRLLNRGLPRPLSSAELEAVAAELGADGPACLHARPVLATGVGERLAPAPETPPLPVVLVNPRRPSPTGAVYRAYDAGPVREVDMPELPESFESPAAVADLLRSCRNDLQAPAIGLEPAIVMVLGILEEARESLFARMSGSGATCFALCPDPAAADSLAARVAAEHPHWWVRACALSSRPDTRVTNS